MSKYILKRLAMMIPVILGMSFFIFVILEMAPGDPAKIILGDKAPAEAVEALREEMGLNDPFMVRYVNYILNALQGDFGSSYRTHLPVFKEIMTRFPTTLALALGSIVLTVVIGVPIGVLSAVKQYSAMDNATMAGALVLASMPGFWLGTMLVLLFASKLHWLPATGADSWKSFVLPCVALMASNMATLVRMTRSNMLEVIRAEYITMARAKGASEKIVIFRHALRNALMPIITIIGMNLSGLLGGTMIIESVFALPGLGTLAVTAVRGKDIPMVMAEVIFIALMAGFINLFVDVLYAYIDPRLKSQYVRQKKIRRAAL